MVWKIIPFLQDPPSLPSPAPRNNPIEFNNRELLIHRLPNKISVSFRSKINRTKSHKSQKKWQIYIFLITTCNLFNSTFVTTCNEYVSSFSVVLWFISRPIIRSDRRVCFVFLRFDGWHTHNSPRSSASAQRGWVLDGRRRKRTSPLVGARCWREKRCADTGRWATPYRTLTRK